MEFTLRYRGPLRSNAGPDQKHEIRKQIHQQLDVLWQQTPLIEHRRYFDGSRPDEDINLTAKVGEFSFVPLVSSKLFLVCGLEIVMLRPEPPGRIITQGGDLDNRLKTLFDALRFPKNGAEIPRGASPAINEEFFFCLLEDDNLITSVAVRADQLLDSTAAPNDVDIFIRVSTKPTRSCFANLGLT